VKTGAVTRRDLPERIEITATLRPLNEVDIYPKVSGRTEQVLVEVGDHVKAGQLLAIIEHRELALQTDQASAQARVAQSALDQAQLAVTEAQRNYDRAKALREKGVISEAEMDAATNALNQAQNQVRSAMSQVQASRSGAGLAAQTLDNSRVVSPIDGTVITRAVGIGAQVVPTRSMFLIQDVSSLKIQGSVTGAEFGRLVKGQKATLTVDDRPGATFGATVSTLSPSLDPSTRRAAIELVVDNVEGKLLPNMFADVKIDVGTLPHALVIPAAAVVATPGGHLVYVLDGDKAVVKRPKLGEVVDDVVVVNDGLDEKAVVLVAGQAGLTDGTQVKVQP
jgi:RND family efflux transporter MFP subunit